MIMLKKTIYCHHALRLMKTPSALLSVAFYMAFVFLSCLLPSQIQAGQSLQQYQGVTSILAKVKQTDDLVDTVHKNPLVLKATGLFLDIADTNHLPEDDLETTFLRLFPLSRWRKWVPAVKIKKIRSGLHLVSIGHAASTQESSLYLFEGRVYRKVDASEAGLIYIEDVETTDSLLTLRYERIRASRREIVTATLVKQRATWKITDVTLEK
jgi:hypothetical protein